MDITSFASGKIIVSGEVNSGKTKFLQKLAVRFALNTKVVVGFTNEKDGWGNIKNIMPTYLGYSTTAVECQCLEPTKNNIEDFIRKTLANEHTCIIDGFGEYPQNYCILESIFNLTGTVILTLQCVGLHAPINIRNAIKNADALIELGDITPYSNQKVYERLGIPPDKIFFVNQ